jgi:hypothetical protein
MIVGSKGMNDYLIKVIYSNIISVLYTLGLVTPFFLVVAAFFFWVVEAVIVVEDHAQYFFFIF